MTEIVERYCHFCGEQVYRAHDHTEEVKKEVVLSMSLEYNSFPSPPDRLTAIFWNGKIYNNSLCNECADEAVEAVKRVKQNRRTRAMMRRQPQEKL